MAKVFIGVGHGGSDPGAVANGFKEKDLNLPIALACRDELQRYGVTVAISRTKDENDTTYEAVEEANKFGADYALEIHNNAGGGDGIEVYYKTTNDKSKTLAQNVIDTVTAIGQNSRGIKVGDGYVWIRTTNMPAVLVECAFVDNATDVKIIDTAAEQKAMGVAIAQGVLKTLGISKPVNTGSDAKVAFAKGDIVYFKGGNHYATAAAKNAAGSPAAGDAKITEIAEGEIHPYHIVHTDDKSSVYGWVNADQLQAKEKPTGAIYRVQVGAYASKANAEAMQKKLKAAGFDAIIV